MNVAKRGGWVGASGVSSGASQSPSPAGEEGRREKELEEGAQRRGEWRERECTLFFLPSSERVAIDTVHLIKICAPSSPLPAALSGAQSPGSCLSRSGHSSSSAVHCRAERKEADREKAGSWAGGGVEEATTTGTEAAASLCSRLKVVVQKHPNWFWLFKQF